MQENNEPMSFDDFIYEIIKKYHNKYNKYPSHNSGHIEGSKRSWNDVNEILEHGIIGLITSKKLREKDDEIVSEEEIEEWFQSL